MFMVTETPEGFRHFYNGINVVFLRYQIEHCGIDQNTVT